MEEALQLLRSFFKAHGHGNDYLVFEEGAGWPVTAASVQRICHRQRGVGGDGIVALLTSLPGPPFRARMFNPDGSEFERSGNGLRILGAYLFSRGLVGVGTPFPVEVGGERVSMEILGETPAGELDVAVDMGRARFGMAAVGGREKDLGPPDPASVPGGVSRETGPGEGGGGSLSGPDGEVLTVQPVAMGNPHCVVFLDELGEEALHRLGPFLTSHPFFPSGVNVQLARVPGPGRVEILIWERGVGRTTSSGTSACAAASACVHRGLLPAGPIRVEMEGGRFLVTVSSTGEVRLEGPVQPLLKGEVSEELLADLRSGPGS